MYDRLHSTNLLSKMINLDTLNPEQRKAVEATEGQVLILAGAGSGKTNTLMHRVAYILDRHLAAPEEMLVVTFTNKAAGEMRERIARMLGASVRIPWMCTFHSMCVKILRREAQHIGFNNSFSIYDPSDQLTAVKTVMDTLRLSTKDINPNAILNFLSMAKNDLIDEETYAGMAQGYFQQTVAQIYPEYQKLLKINNAMDFDDLLMKTVQLFQRNPHVLKKYQQQFKYIMVDEYQDTNHTQYQLMKMLAAGSLNICCVGDDDQSIYAFRGATIRNILNFERDYPDAHVIKLEQNYRSTKLILEASHQVVSKNENRKDKKLWTQNDDGQSIKLYEAENEKDEGRWIADKISDLIDSNVSPKEIAILYRTNAQSRALEEQMLRGAVNYKVVGGIRFYDRKEIKDILAYVRILYNPFDNTSFQRIVNVPRRGIGAKTLSNMEIKAQVAQLSLTNYITEHVEEVDNPGLQRFGKLLIDFKDKVESLNVVDLLNYILDRSGYLEMLRDGTLENESRIENIQELISLAAKFADLSPEDSLTEFLQEVALYEGLVEDNTDEYTEKVTLMTIHAAKGLEFEYVFIAGMEEGLFPHSRVYSNPKELEEERRLAYVALTRAKKQLHLTYAQSRVFFGKSQHNLVSRFVEDIDPELMEKRSYILGDFADGGWEDVEDSKPKMEDLSIGDRIKHDYFGVGMILDLEDGKAKVNFGPLYGTKELVLEFAPISKL